MLDALALTALIGQCAPGQAAAPLVAIVREASGFEPLVLSTIQSGRPLSVQALSKDEAVALAMEMRVAGQRTRLGLAGLDSRAVERLGLPVGDVFEPCTNLRVAARLLKDDPGALQPLGRKSGVPSPPLVAAPARMGQPWRLCTCHSKQRVRVRVAAKGPAMSVDLTDPIFHNEDAARLHFEAIRWPEGPCCPHCGVVDQATLLKGKSHRSGMYQCNACREPFTVTVGSVMESSHVPLHKWALGFHLMAASKKGVSANQLMRTLGLGSYRTAWFMAHRIREAMAPAPLQKPLGSGGGIVESDETFIGRKPGVAKKGGGFGHKMKVHSLVERGGSIRSVVVEKVSRETLETIIRANVSPEAHLRTDTAQYYIKSGFGTASHAMVNHYKGEYVRGDAHTNTLEGYYSVFKRGMKGIYQHCSERHLHRYVAEFDFRYNNRIKLGVDDTGRAMRAIKSAAGRRLTYKQSGASQSA